MEMVDVVPFTHFSVILGCFGAFYTLHLKKLFGNGNPCPEAPDAHCLCYVNARGGLDPAVIESAIRTIYGVTLFCYFRWSATVLLSYYDF